MDTNFQVNTMYKYKTVLFLILTIGSFSLRAQPYSELQIDDQPSYSDDSWGSNDSWGIVQWAGHLGNGVEGGLRVIKITQKLFSIYATGGSPWLAVTLAYNVLEASDHAAEAFDLDLRSFIADWVDWLYPESKETAYKRLNDIRLTYLTAALAMDLTEIFKELDQGVIQSMMNTMASLVTIYNLQPLVTEKIYGTNNTHNPDEL